MTRKTRSTPKRGNGRNQPARARSADARDAVIEATMRLAEEKDWENITLQEIARAADMPLAEVHARFHRKADILDALARRTDTRLLESLERDPLEGDTGERLFELIMRRLELLAPYRRAIARLSRQPAALAAECPLLLPGVIVSRQWMLAAAGAERPGLEGGVRLLGVSWVYWRALSAWVEDDDPGLGKTMATLDSALKNGGIWLSRLDAPMRAARAARDAFRALLCVGAAALSRERNSGGEAPTDNAPGQREDLAGRA